MALESDIDAAHRLPQRSTDEPHPIIVKCFKRADKRMVMKKRKLLKSKKKVIRDVKAKRSWLKMLGLGMVRYLTKTTRIEYGEILD
jgi:hypothetical protein